MSAINFPELAAVHCHAGVPGIEHPLVIKSRARDATFYSARGATSVTTEGLSIRSGALARLLDTRELHNYATKARGCAAAGGLTPPQTTALRALGDKLDEIGRSRPHITPRRN
jgi:hypothetical protein